MSIGVYNGLLLKITVIFGISNMRKFMIVADIICFPRNMKASKLHEKNLQYIRSVTLEDAEAERIFQHVHEFHDENLSKLKKIKILSK